jgi:hypothetical protein
LAKKKEAEVEKQPAPVVEAPPVRTENKVSQKIPKLLPKNKSRLPRKQKKAAKKAAARQ